MPHIEQFGLLSEMEILSVLGILDGGERDENAVTSDSNELIPLLDVEVALGPTRTSTIPFAHLTHCGCRSSSSKTIKCILRLSQYSITVPTQNAVESCLS
jgi:hypothetical protein